MSREDLPIAALPRPVRATALREPSRTLDHRVHAHRRDLADIALVGRVIASHYAEPLRMQCAGEPAVILGSAEPDASPVSELLPGEGFDVLELSNGRAWGRCVHDGYVGYLPEAALGPAGPPATHRVAVRLALVFAGASIKSPVVARWPLGSLAAALGEEGSFVRVAEGFIHRRHLAAMTELSADPVAVAALLVGAPYGWGGRSERGIDCSGLVQVALAMCGIACPRDTDQQRAALGEAADPAQPRRRGDLVYFPGHVGLMVDAGQLLHANAHWMRVVTEPLADVIARLRPDHAEPVIAVRRV